MRELIENQYAEAKKIIFVCDNLNTHIQLPGSVDEAPEGKRPILKNRVRMDVVDADPLSIS